MEKTIFKSMLLLKPHIPENILTDDFLTGEEPLAECQLKMDVLDSIIDDPNLNEHDLEMLSQHQIALSNRIRILILCNFDKIRHRP